ncbi:hypothetical protein PR048_024933 [Dryococelus australis]|uniref:Uncharacterized protein n=1 Tax=Dryococelus australis TaxID=614101 RepID=A0ABQ9GPX5_9NEOP|nr:hypothetical protein PR048_024933 [Dryococelus australis]
MFVITDVKEMYRDRIPITTGGNDGCGVVARAVSKTSRSVCTPVADPPERSRGDTTWPTRCSQDHSEQTHTSTTGVWDGSALSAGVPRRVDVPRAIASSAADLFEDSPRGVGDSCAQSTSGCASSSTWLSATWVRFGRVSAALGALPVFVAADQTAVSLGNSDIVHNLPLVWRSCKIYRLLCEVWNSSGMQEQGKRDIPEKTRRPAESSGRIPTFPGRESNPARLGRRRVVQPLHHRGLDNVSDDITVSIFWVQQQHCYQPRRQESKGNDRDLRTSQHTLPECYWNIAISDANLSNNKTCMVGRQAVAGMCSVVYFLHEVVYFLPSHRCRRSGGPTDRPCGASRRLSVAVSSAPTVAASVENLARGITPADLLTAPLSWTTHRSFFLRLSRDHTMQDAIRARFLYNRSHDQHTRTKRIATCIALHERNRTCSISSFREFVQEIPVQGRRLAQDWYSYCNVRSLLQARFTVARRVRPLSARPLYIRPSPSQAIENRRLKMRKTAYSSSTHVPNIDLPQSYTTVKVTWSTVMNAEAQFNVGTRRLVVRSQRDRSTSSLVYVYNQTSYFRRKFIAATHGRKDSGECEPYFPAIGDIKVTSTKDDSVVDSRLLHTFPKPCRGSTSRIFIRRMQTKLNEV